MRNAVACGVQRATHDAKRVAPPSADSVSAGAYKLCARFVPGSFMYSIYVHKHRGEHDAICLRCHRVLARFNDTRRERHGIYV